MFTGIVQTQGQISAIVQQPQFRRLQIHIGTEFLTGLQRGASIAINGTCLTATEFDLEQGWVMFDVIAETLTKTNLGQLQLQDRVNVERSLKFGDEIGGHIVSGHVHTTAELIQILPTAHNVAMQLRLPVLWQNYLFSKGFVAVDGISLTVGEVAAGDFWLHLIPETLAVTNLGQRNVGEQLNIELDQQSISTVQTIERIMAARGLS